MTDRLKVALQHGKKIMLRAALQHFGAIRPAGGQHIMRELRGRLGEGLPRREAGADRGGRSAGGAAIRETAGRHLRRREPGTGED